MRTLLQLLDALAKPKSSETLLAKLVDLEGCGRGPEIRDKEPDGIRVDEFWERGLFAAVGMRSGPEFSVTQAARMILMDQIYTELQYGEEMTRRLTTPKNCDGCAKWFIPERSMKQIYCAHACKYRVNRFRKRANAARAENG